MDCKTVKNNLSAFIDDELAYKKPKEINTHLLECPKCKAAYDKLREVHDALTNAFEPEELPDGFREELINNAKASLSIEGKVKIKTLSAWRLSIYWILNNRRQILKRGCVLVSLLLLLFISMNLIPAVLDGGMKYHAPNIVEESSFKTIEEAQKYPMEIPFIPPQNIKPIFRLKEIVYTKDRDNSCSVSFNYMDDNHEELSVDYHSKGDNIDRSYNISSVNPSIVKVNTETGWGLSGYEKNPTGNGPLSNKGIGIDLPKYIVGVGINYNRGVTDADSADDQMLADILQGYLNSEIFNAKGDADLFDVQTIRYKDFTELQNFFGNIKYTRYDWDKKSYPIDVKIEEPKYIPKGFNLKYITLKYFKDNPAAYFNAVVTYENPEGTLLSISYQTLGKGGIYQINNNIVQTSKAFRIQFNGSGKGYFAPYIEKHLPFTSSVFDLNIYLQYKADKAGSDMEYNNEIRRILDGLVD